MVRKNKVPYGRQISYLDDGPSIIQKIVKLKYIPQDDYYAIKDVKPVADIIEGTLRYDLEEHLDGKNGREDYVTKLHR